MSVLLACTLIFPFTLALVSHMPSVYSVHQSQFGKAVLCQSSWTFTGHETLRAFCLVHDESAACWQHWT